jgi:hypothetical protein
MRSEPTELIPHPFSGITKVMIQMILGKRLRWGVVEIWLKKYPGNTNVFRQVFIG